MSDVATNALNTHYRACHLCEAICGLEIKTQGDEIISIKGDKNDPISQGYICPKATAIADIHNDPDRLRKPVKRIANEWIEISWDEAIDLTAQKLVETQKEHGDNAVAFYAGNPGVHNYGNLTHGALLRRALKTKNATPSINCLCNVWASIFDSDSRYRSHKFNGDIWWQPNGLKRQLNDHAECPQTS